MKILIADKLSETGIEVLREAEEFEVDNRAGISPEELLGAIGAYHALVVRSATKVTAEVLEQGRNLKVVGRAGIGVDNIDVSAATRRGIVVMNAPEANTVTTAEHAISMMLALAKNIPQATISIKRGAWEKSRFVGSEVFNKTLGVVGVGRIGRIVVRRARALEMKVLAYDPYISASLAEELGVELLPLEELLERSDFVTLHVPLSDATRHMIGAEQLARMKSSARLINCARGGLVDEEALYNALKSGRLAGAALDVFENEPPGKSPLFELDNVICTPHLGASTNEAQRNVAVAIGEQIRDFLLKGIIHNAINVPCVPREQLARMAPYLILGEALGGFVAQLAEGGVTGVDIEFRGEICSLGTPPVTVAVLKGILGAQSKDVNMVNAPVLAKERGIEISEKTVSTSPHFASLVSVKIITDKGERTIAGTLFLGRDPRVVQLDGYHLEAQLAGQMLVVSNRDVPGVIGKLGTLLGDNDVNIAGMALGRTSPRGVALAIFNVDESIRAPVLEQIRALPFILSAHSVHLGVVE